MKATCEWKVDLWLVKYTSCMCENMRVCVRVATASLPCDANKQKTHCAPSSSPYLTLIYFMRIKSPVNFLKTREVNFTFTGSPPMAQFAALAGSRRVDESFSSYQSYLCHISPSCLLSESTLYHCPVTVPFIHHD